MPSLPSIGLLLLLLWRLLLLLLGGVLQETTVARNASHGGNAIRRGVH